MKKLEIDIVYTDKGRLYKIVLSRYEGFISSSIDRTLFELLFNLKLPDVYDYAHMDVIKRAIETEWKGMIEVSHNDAMDVS